MATKTIIWLLYCSVLFKIGISKTIVNVDAIFHKSQTFDEINWDIVGDNLDSDYAFYPAEPKIMQDTDSFEAVKILCHSAAQENGLAAVFGSGFSESSNTLESICRHLGIPYIVTNWKSKDSLHYETSFNVYPEASLLAQAYVEIVDSLDWDTFAVVYENEEGLLKLQDVLKLQQHKNGLLKNTVLLRKLDASGDSRYIFKQIGNTTISRIVLDCETDKILDLLAQAKEVKMLMDFTTNFFLTSLDAHLLDFSILNTRANITTVRMYDPYDYRFQRKVGKLYQDLAPNQIPLKTALMHDAMLLLAESLNSIKSTHSDADIVYEPLFCNATEKYNDKYGLVPAMQEVIINHGLTGEISLKNGKRDTFELQVIEFDKPNKPIGIWSSEDPTKVFLTRNATEREAELQRRIQNHNFIVTSRIGEPYLYKNDSDGLVGNARYYGFSMDLFIEIAKILNMTFEFQITKENEYGNLQIDLVERRADFAICDFTITPQRREVIDFSMPFMSLGIGILHKKSLQEDVDNMYGFLGPLSTVVWLYIGILYLFISFALLLVARMSTEDWENPHPCDENPSELENIWDLKNCCWLTLGSICTQGCDLLPKGICTRIATASWWFFSLIITSSYTANLAAFLTMSRKDDSINSVEELASQSKIKYGCVKGGSTGTFLSNSNNSIYQRMWNTMVNEKPSVFESSNAKGVERINSTKNGLYAFFMESTGIEFELERKCEMRKIGNLLDSKSYGIGMPMNAEYRHSINKAVLQLQETGKLGELKDVWWKQRREGDPCPSETPENTDALALANVGGVFIVLGVCIGISFVIAILELLWNVYNVSVEEHIPFLEALEIELKFACNVFVTKKRAKPVASESSSSKSEENYENKSNTGILTGAGSILNIHSGILNRVGSKAGSALNIDDASLRTRKSSSKISTH